MTFIQMIAMNLPSKMISSLALFGWAVAMLISCQDHQAEGAGQASASVPEFPVIAIETMDVVSEKIYPATVEGIENIGIRAKVDGYIEQTFVEEGQCVQKGQSVDRKSVV